MEKGPREPYLVGREAITSEKFCVQLKISMHAELNGQVHYITFATSQIPTVVNICDTLYLGFVLVLVIRNAG
jgi:hypothetical protein